jgi:anti-sigma factor RsiW
MSADEERLHAFIDGALPPAERAAFEAFLLENPEEGLRLRAYVEQRGRLRQAFDPVLSEPVPARMHLRRPPWLDVARAAALVALGIAIGLAIPLLRNEPPASVASAPAPVSASLAQRAARAHATFAAEVRHAVEVDAGQQEHLVRWLSKRLGTELKVPVLGAEGFELLGGRLLPGPEGPVAQFMYQDGGGKRLTLYVNARARSEGPTAFRFVKEGPVSVFYWIDGQWGYALSGDIDKPALSRVADVVYRQLNP